MLYNVQCMDGHVGIAPSGSELEERCRQNEAEGFLDALCISAEECDDCKEERRRNAQLARELDMYLAKM